MNWGYTLDRTLTDKDKMTRNSAIASLRIFLVQHRLKDDDVIITEEAGDGVNIFIGEVKDENWVSEFGHCGKFTRPYKLEEN